MPRILGFLLAAAAAALMAACTSDKPEDPNSVTTIPWNRPEKWEGQGPMGGMMPGSN
ncbi:MAG: hypothetical protein P4L99_14080 [Chthoniobacter sp.]|nr:hypothetical protein [Chthoniobacter sp.]